MIYSQLCTFSSYSFGESLILPSTYAKRAKELGYTNIAIIDHNTYAYPSFADACKKEGLHPIFGYSFLLKIKNSYPIQASVFLKNEEGYLNLCKLLLNAKNEYDLNEILLVKQGMKLVIHANSETFFDDYYLTLISPEIERLKKEFPKEFAIGLSLNTKEDSEDSKILLLYAKEHEIPVISFPEVRYLHKGEASSLAILKAGRKKEALTEIIEQGPYFLLSPKVLESIYPLETLKNTEEFTKNLSFSFFEKRGSMIFIKNDKDILKEHALQGLTKKLNCAFLPEVYQKRLDDELQVIDSMNFASYFLVVEDYVSYAKKQKIKVGPGRGSSGGSLIAYALGITEVDPLKYDLSFERFLNVKRQTMPDIDIDFDDKRRDEVVTYLKQKYTPSHVSTIRTFITIRPKSALSYVGIAFSVPENRIKRLTQDISDKAKSFKEALLDEYKGYKLRKTLQDPYYRDLVEKAEKLLDLPINTSIHAPGIILSQNDIAISCPRESGNDGPVEYEYPYMERMGFLKFDILPLSNLSFIQEIEEEIKKDGKELISFTEHFDDTSTFKTLNSLALTDIFQLDATFGIKKAIQEIQPSSFQDIAAILALYRPGPMEYISTFASRKNGKEKFSYLLPELEPVLKETYGVMVYQEQVMKAVQILASFDAADADLFRRAISKKDLSKMKDYKNQFLSGCLKNGIVEDTALKVYQDIEQFAGYGFNKSHAYAYAMITYQLLFLKTHYQEEFYRVALRNTSFSGEKATKILQELELSNIVCLLPDINKSKMNDIYFEKNAIYPPLSSVLGVDRRVLSLICEEREKAIFESFYNFCLRIAPKLKENDESSLLALIDAGCFDCFSKSRKGLEDKLNSYLQFALLYFEQTKIPPVENIQQDYGERLLREKAKLGRILSATLTSIFSKNYYRTFIVSDISRYETERLFAAESENQSYLIHDSMIHKLEKNSFVLVKAEFFKNKNKIYAEEVIPCGKRGFTHV